MKGRPLPLAVWAGVLSTGAVLTCAGVSAAALSASSLLGARTAGALALGALSGLGVCAVAVLMAHRLATTLRGLRRDAVHRLQVPSAPLDRAAGRPLTGGAGRELIGLASVLEALHLRVRLGDQVAERHRLEAETAGAGVFELLSGLVAAEEGARGQLAAELHDTVAQSLMVARSLVHAGIAGPADLDTLSDHIEDAEEQVRAVMARTRPPALREGDLALAVGNLRLDMQARYALDVQVVWPPAPYPLPLATAITVYRFFQEALLNVIKHADVDEAVVELVVGEDVVRARVVDAGPGFDPCAVRPSGGRHVGLGLLRERARLSGGHLDVTSVLGSGTTLTLELPRRQAPAPWRPIPAASPFPEARPAAPPTPSPARGGRPSPDVPFVGVPELLLSDR